MKALSIGSAGSAVGMHLITGGTNATPIVVTFAAESGLKTGDRIAISGITGLTAMNGEWEIEMVTATTAKLLGSVGNGTYGGTPLCASERHPRPLARELQIARVHARAITDAQPDRDYHDIAPAQIRRRETADEIQPPLARREALVDIVGVVEVVD